MTTRRFFLAAGAAVFLALAMGAATAVWPMSSIAEGRVGPTIPDAVEPAADPTTFAVIGDSISTRASREGVDMSVGSWTTYASSGGAEYVADGWAESGAKLLEMFERTTPVGTDVVVVLAGTNDLDGQLTIDNRLWLVNEIVKKAAAPRVIISAVPPLDSDPAASTEWNNALRGLALENSWKFVDPWSTLRTVDNTYVAGFTPDGMHPTAGAAIVVGEALRVAIVAVPAVLA